MKLNADLSALPRRLRLGLLLPVAAACLAACGGGGGSSSNPLALLAAASSTSPTPAPAQPENPCPETGPYACKSGETEPLYAFQWALNYVKSWFTDHADAGAYGGGIDLNVEPVHRQGIKGQGIKVLVIDTGVDLANEDLQANANYEMSWNYDSNSNDPSPLLTVTPGAHGTHVAGIIGAAQNGKGVMGIAPQVKIGGVPLIETGQGSSLTHWFDAYGGAKWSQDMDIINGSFGGVTQANNYSTAANPFLIAMHGLKDLRAGKGAVFIKSAGNSFDGHWDYSQFNSWKCGPVAGAIACYNPGNDSVALEPNVVLTAALNAKGQASSYSSSGSVLWITGLGGEYGSQGRYGESSRLSASDIANGRTGDGPVIFSTDIRGCAQGYSKKQPAYNTQFLAGTSERVSGTKDNANCDYGYMNGTSAAAPTISGVVALMLSANPELSWRDVRDILRMSARAIDADYEKRTRYDIQSTLSQPYNALFDLSSNRFATQTGGAERIVSGATQVPVELGWTTNAAGNRHSNWYGFGVPDTAKAVELAQLYKKEPARSKPSAQPMPAFSKVATLNGFEYQKVSLLGEFDSTEQVVDAFQVRLTGTNLCLGSLGLAVESPSGTKSLLKMPQDHFAFWDAAQAVAKQQPVVLSKSTFDNYGAGSYAFYGENAKGTWKIYAVASNPQLDPSGWGSLTATCDAAPADGLTAANATLVVEARVIAQ